MTQAKERLIRAQKRRVLAAEASGDKEGLLHAQTRLQILRQNYSRFSKAAGLRMEKERTWVVNKKPIAAAADAIKNTGKLTKYNDKANYSFSIPGHSEEVNDALSKAAEKVAKLGSADNKEHLELIDLKTANSIYSETGTFDEVGFSHYEAMMKNPNAKFAFVHNHNTDGWLSERDLTTLLTNEQIEVIIAARNDGVIYVAPKNLGAKLSTLPRVFYADEMAEFYKLRNEGKLSNFEFVTEKKMVENMIRDFVGGYFEHDGR